MTVNPGNGVNRYERNNPDFGRDVATLSGCAVMIRRQAIESVGPVFLEPEFFAYYEETDFFLRLLRQGWKLRYEPSAEVWHRGGASSSGYFSWFHQRRNYFLYVARNFDQCLLQKVIRKETWKRWRDILTITWGVGVARNEKARARRDAQRWLAMNVDRLKTIAASRRTGETSISDLIRKIQAKWVETDRTC
jgi:GT2 family glycosyltransferase